MTTRRRCSPSTSPSAQVRSSCLFDWFGRQLEKKDKPVYTIALEQMRNKSKLIPLVACTIAEQNMLLLKIAEVGNQKEGTDKK